MSTEFRFVTILTLHAVLHLLLLSQTGLCMNQSNTVVRTRVLERKILQGPVPYGVSGSISEMANKEGYSSAKMSPEHQRGVEDSYHSRCMPDVQHQPGSPVAHADLPTRNVHQSRRRSDFHLQSSTPSGEENEIRHQTESLENQPGEHIPILRHHSDPGTLDWGQNLVWHEDKIHQKEMVGRESEGYSSDIATLEREYDALRLEMKELQNQMTILWSGSHGSHRGVLDWRIDSLWEEMEALKIEVKEVKLSLGHLALDSGKGSFRHELEERETKENGIRDDHSGHDRPFGKGAA